MAELLATTATLQRGLAVKFIFLLLAVADFLFTLMALRLGLTELNPVVVSLANNPGYFFLFKVLVSFFLAWLIPSRLLLPSLALLTFVVAWNVKELLLYFL